MTESISKRELDRRGICHLPENAEYWELFYADTALERRAARNLCGSCPVREECLKWALEKKEIWGVWGGCDEADLRRALWVDANGEPTERCRYPHCPSCKARPSKLFISSLCELRKGHRREQVECMTCGFTWRAATSVAAVKAYWRERSRKVRAKARASRVRIPSERPRNVVRVEFPSARDDEPTTALAASAARHQATQ